MKDFWWRKRTDPPPVQPPRHVEFRRPDAGSTLWNTPPTLGTARWGSRLGLHRKNCCFQSLPPPSKPDHASEAAIAGEMARSAVERLQETIRFVFSHEQEGLLAIGTCALDQLAGVRVDQLKPAESTTGQTCLHNLEFQSETELQQSSVKEKELPVFGDDDAPSDLHPRTLTVVETTINLPIAPVIKSIPASSLKLSSGSANLADSECTPEHYQPDEEDVFSPKVCGLFSSTSRRKQKLGENQKQLPREKRDCGETKKILPIAPVLKHSSASTLILSTGFSNLADSECTPEHYQSDDEVFLPGEVFSSCVCGLFGSRSRRKQKLGQKQNEKQLPPENRDGVETKKTLPIAPVLKYNLASTSLTLSTGSKNLADTKCTQDWPEHYQSEEEVSSPGFWGLFGSRSSRRQKLGEKENEKQLTPEKREGLETDAFLQASVNLEKPYRSNGFKVSSLGRLWRSGCSRPPVANQVSPAPELSPTVLREPAQLEGMQCIANVELDGAPKAAAAVKFSSEVPYPALLPCEQKAGEGGERMRCPSFGSGAWACAQNGKWIRTDCEFVVLEM